MRDPVDAGSDAEMPDGPIESGAPLPEAGPDPGVGGPCARDAQCDDGIECTRDRCDTDRGLCLFVPDQALCADDVYCDGIEQCVPGIGCREGEPVACSDGTTCTIDRCVEETRSCVSRPRDADGDGDGVWNCEGGGDCDDSDPRVSSLAPERCNNNRDDDCDGVTDERDCSSPENDTCVEPLLIEESGTYVMTLASASEDMPIPCADTDGLRRDVVAALVVPEGPPIDVDITLLGDSADLALAVFADCTDPSSVVACRTAVPRVVRQGRVARTIVRALEPGTYPVFVSGTTDESVTLAVKYGTALPLATNEACESAVRLAPGSNQEVSLADLEQDLGTACEKPDAEVVFEFELEEAGDVEITAASLDDYGEPTVSLRDEPCEPSASELACRSGAPTSLFARALDPGKYYAAIGATGPSDVAVRLQVSPPTEAPPTERCEAAPELVPGTTEEMTLARRQDAVASSCLIGAPEATYSLTIEEPSDVLLVQRISDNDTGAVALLNERCEPASALACERGTQGPVRARAYGVPPGEYRAVAESQLGSPITFTAFVRRSLPPVLVSLSDSCEDAVSVDETGGRFLGNTTNAYADFEASCDFGGAPPGGGNEQILKLTLDRARRVVLDMRESSYDTLLVVRRATTCPGEELTNACAPGYLQSRSYLDLTLAAGDYWLQIDGYDGDSGAWVLDVFTAEPSAS